MFLRYYDEIDIIRCCQFCKNWAPLTYKGCFMFFIVFQLEKMLWIVLKYTS